MSEIGLLIFDCDGVLVDSEVVSVAVMKRVLADVGWVLTSDEIIGRFVGGSKEHFDSQIEEELGHSLPADWHRQYAPWYQEAFERELQAIPGIEHAIDALTVPYCVASNSNHTRIRRSLELTGLFNRFDGRIFSAQDVRRPKPAPDLYLFTAECMGVSPADCLVVEDSRYGVQAARAAGMTVLGYSGGLTPESWLEEEGATVFTSMDQLSELIVATSGSS
ncbi:MAG: HAD family hydrolase [Microbacteriaceae bacterium]|nr:MAG: HAD family hydrolase [Microbacteriaceae bacterium]